MAELAKNTRCTTVASMRYRDADCAIAFLCDAFGFERYLVVLRNPPSTDRSGVRRARLHVP